MRNPRLLVLGALIAAALIWLYFVLPRPPAAAPAPPAAAAAPPPPARHVAAQPPAPPPTLPPTVPIAPPVVPPGDDPPHAEPVPAEDGETAAEEDPPAVPPADPDRAADLFADLLAEQEAEPEKDRLPNTARDLWKRFDQEKPDEDWSAAATPKLQDSLDRWVGELPEGTGDHIALVHVECRASLCQVLAADNDLSGQGARAQSGQEWQQAIAGLRGQPWWGESGFTDMTTQVVTTDGYVLYTTYLLRGGTPSS
jgi:hypothetical protein